MLTTGQQAQSTYQQQQNEQDRRINAQQKSEQTSCWTAYNQQQTQNKQQGQQKVEQVYCWVKTKVRLATKKASAKEESGFRKKRSSA